MAQTKKEKAEQQLLDLDVKLREAELRKAAHEEKQAEAAARTAALEANDLERVLKYDERSRQMIDEAKKTRVSKLNGVVSERMADYLREDFSRWEREDKVDRKKPVPVTILINSPGGYVIPGLDMFDLIMAYRDKGWTINTKVTGMAMSMAGVLLQAGEERTMTPRSTFMLHEVASYAEGKTSDMEDQIAFTKSLQEHCSKILADRAAIDFDEVNELWRRRDVFLTAEETLAKGFIDRIAL